MPWPATCPAHLGEQNRRKALKDADYVINAIQVRGYEPSTVIDFEMPRKLDTAGTDVRHTRNRSYYPAMLSILLTVLSIASVVR